MAFVGYLTMAITHLLSTIPLSEDMHVSSPKNWELLALRGSAQTQQLAQFAGDLRASCKLRSEAWDLPSLMKSRRKVREQTICSSFVAAF